MKSLVCVLVISLLLTGCEKGPANTPEEEYTDAFIASEASVNYEEAEQMTEEPTAHEEKLPDTESSVYGRVIVVDPGHGKNPSKEKEPVAPSAVETKAMFATGTHGKNQTEAELVLKIAQRLYDELTERGAVVYMTREDENTTLSNVGRAQFANDLNADISVKIHADGAENTSAHGASMLVPGNMYLKDQSLVDECYRAGEIILNEYIKATGAKNRGMSVRNDMTGFNWSTVPVVLIEMGFMTNPEEDALMETEEYQEKIVTGLVRGLEVYFAQ